MKAAHIAKSSSSKPANVYRAVKRLRETGGLRPSSERSFKHFVYPAKTFKDHCQV
ncbi:hypothetical protein KIN20_008941 [Parelaphostrongylus tenuis]|uniref:Uncharacterized protein n=1 Tax=Parelaphostrongylus tenuis TaxID=148309 RepID=A0AAD5QHW1_PARTN|nr:hypothetical protein KIN20_008941 [Parelaphostrongylus tenuis]